MNIADENAKAGLNTVDVSFHNLLGRMCLFIGAAMLISGQIGCRPGERLFPNLKLGSLPRIPAPSTGTLRFPGLSGSGSAPLSPPPSQINVGQAGTSSDNTPASGVFFQTPGGPYSSGQGNPTTGQPLNSIPNRSSNPLSASSLGGPGSSQPAGNVANVANAANTGSVAFDPFRTGVNPTWANNQLAAVGLSQNPNNLSSNQNNIPAVSQPDASRPGWYAGNQTVASTSPGGGGTGFFSAQNPQNNQQQLAIGNGGLLQRMNNSIKGFFNQQPANLGGFQTTAPVNMPDYSLNPGGQVAPAAYYSPNYARQQGVVNGQSGVPAGRVPLLNQGQLAAGPQYQVLGENSTSLMAENQARLGIRSGAANSGSAYAQGGGQAGGGVYPIGRPPISATANADGGVNSEWVPVNAIR